ncbi:MAG TPA: CRISPR-associated endonuclease Cas1 [Methanocorpusculum sp.]|nr:CRISPR-associated endonuclease Cas1 [Methanocorpusculum sp.]
MLKSIDWVTIWGYKSHIKVDNNVLVVSKGSTKSVYPLSSFKHLLIVGGHILDTSSISYLMNNNICISFFTIHGEPVGTVLPSNYNFHRIPTIQKNISVHKSALSVLVSSLSSRIKYLNELNSVSSGELYYKGEQDILNKAYAELEYLITLPELLRVFLLTRDMYYEILSRKTPHELNYQRRVNPPYKDPVNAMFSHGYAVLYANVCVSAVGAGLDLDIGALYGPVVPIKKNQFACVLDIMEPLKTQMVDDIVMKMVQDGCVNNQYEVSTRCILSETLIHELNLRLSKSISKDSIDTAVKSYVNSIC